MNLQNIKIPESGTIEASDANTASEGNLTDITEVESASPVNAPCYGKIQPLLELVKDWDTPLTKFHKGHVNNAEQWAEIVGCSLEDFYSYLSQGVFTDWFRIYNENRP